MARVRAEDLAAELSDARATLLELDPAAFLKHCNKYRSGARSGGFEPRVSGSGARVAPTSDQVDRAIEAAGGRYVKNAKEIVRLAELLALEERRMMLPLPEFDEDPSTFVCRSCGDVVTNTGNDRLRKGECQACYAKTRRNRK